MVLRDVDLYSKEKHYAQTTSKLKCVLISPETATHERPVNVLWLYNLSEPWPHFLYFVRCYSRYCTYVVCSIPPARCQPGTRLVDGRCEYCDRGTYADHAGLTSCVPCPAGYQTDFVGSRERAECIGMCFVKLSLITVPASFNRRFLYILIIMLLSIQT